MSHDDSVQSSRNGRQAANVASTADPEVVPKAERRRFTAAYKLRILTEADACTQRGEIGALLRREGLDRVISNCGLRRDPHMVVLKTVVQTGIRPPKTCHDTAKQRRQATRRSQSRTNICRTG